MLLVVLLWWGSPSGFAASEDAEADFSPQTAGLMWNRTGLPAVFPLQIKSPTGRDYFLILIDHETGKEALAAYINGGAFFKVLVPPGTYRLSFATGMVWRGEEELFGPGALTQLFELENPLTFEIRNPAIKAGHIVDLRAADHDRMAQAHTTEQFICQTFRWEHFRFPLGHEIRRDFERPENAHLIWSWHGQPLFPVRHKDGRLHPPMHFAYRHLRPHRTVRARICG